MATIMVVTGQAQARTPAAAPPLQRKSPKQHRHSRRRAAVFVNSSSSTTAPLPDFALDGPFYKAIPQNFERHPEHSGGDGFGNDTFEEHAIKTGKGSELHKIKSGKGSELHAIKCGKGSKEHANKSKNKAHPAQLEALQAAGFIKKSGRGSCPTKASRLRHTVLPCVVEVLKNTEFDKALVQNLLTRTNVDKVRRLHGHGCV